MSIKNDDTAMSEPPETSSTPATTRILPFIPVEISHLIARYLNLSSAIRLMRVCRALSVAGEIRAYAVLDITGSWATDTTNASLTSLSEAEYQYRASVVDVRLQRALSTFNKHPYRAAYVRTLRLEPSDGGGERAENVIALLALLSRHLNCLEILPLPARYSYWTDDQLAEFGSARFFTRMTALNLSFDRLTRFKYAYPAQAHSPLDARIMRMPNLTEIELSSADSLFPTTPLTSHFPPSPFHSLRRVTFDHVADDPAAPNGTIVLAGLLQLAPNLVYLRLRGHWRASSEDFALRALGRLRGLRTVVTVDHNHQYDESNGIEISRLGKVFFPVEDAAFEYGDWFEWKETKIHRISFPQAPTLRRLSILTTSRPPLAEYASIPLGLTPLAPRHIRKRFLHQLARCPLLSSILFLHLSSPFPESYAVDYTEPSYFVPSTRWIEEGHRGMIIREYEGPREMDKVVFWHVRVLSREVHNGGDSYVGTRRYIEDWTEFQGRTVPRHVLNAVYREAGEDAEFMSGGRGMRLGKGDGAWRILKQWRECVGDESDTEDGFALDGTEDDDLLTDDEQ